MRFILVTLSVLCAACDGGKVYEGELRVESAGDLALLDGVTIVDGDLQITAEDISELTLNSLEEVKGDLWVRYNTRMTSLTMNSLSAVSGGLSIAQNERLATINMDNLSSVGGSFAISYNCKLPSFRADAIADQVTISCNGVDAAGTCVNTGPNFGDDGC